MSSKCLDIFADSELDQLADAALSVLERAGVMYQSDAILDALENAGAGVDRGESRARLPRRMVEPIIEHQRARQGEQAARPRSASRGAAADVPLPGIGLQVAQFYYDHDRGERRRGNRDDLIRMIHFGDALDERLSVDHVLLMHEEPPLVEPLEALLLLMEHSSRPGRIYPHYAAQLPYLEEIGEIQAGDSRHYLMGNLFLVSPLRMGERACDLLVALAKRGIASSMGTQPVSGISAPVTRAGTIVVGAAEILAGWAASFALDPDLPLWGGIESGSVDMPTGNVTFCSPESLLQDLGCVELFRRRFGGRVTVAGGADYTSAKLPGYQAGFEKAVEAMTICAYTGGHPRLGAGLLDSGKLFSPLQLLLDREFQSFLLRFAAGAEVNQEQIASDLIASVGSGIGRSYLDSEHTASHYRQSLWCPRLLDRRVWRGDEQERDADGHLLARAEAQFREIMGRYQAPEVDWDKVDSIRQVVARARRELGDAVG